MAANLIRIGLLLISWTSLIFLPKKSFHKFLPVTLFSSALVLIVYAVNIQFEKLNLYKLIYYKRIYFFLNCIGFAAIIYGYQNLLKRKYF
ncbi:hypothetical protein [Bacillus xiapuensis]|uniref:Uncharacterized protein n=1 Tax=Bacillus xiapuensis TaxID=2014075 RepID=A0ABU6N649_9BACI|nr:hypothetical protein [Bacillus xiapuensis]